MSELCMFCDQPATRWCDAPLALVKGGESTYKGITRPVSTMEAMLSGSYTCDAPFCAAHGNKVGHICGAEPDTIDHCHIHAGAPKRNGVLTLDEIAKLRRELHAPWHRRKLRDAVSSRESADYWRERALAAESLISETPNA